MKVILNEILTEKRNLPPSIGYTSDHSVILVDAFGKRMPLPLELCFSYDVRFFSTAPILEDRNFTIC
jgi:hypothetical protein